MKVIVRAGTKTWFVGRWPPVAEFVQATEVEVEGPTRGGWYVSTEDIPGFPSGKRVFLTCDMFDVVPKRGYWEDGDGNMWEDEAPGCSYCTRKATRVTPVEDILLCDEETCWRDFIIQECCSEITFVDESLEDAAREHATAVHDQVLDDLVGLGEPLDKASVTADEEAEAAYQEYMEEHDGD